MYGIYIINIIFNMLSRKYFILFLWMKYFDIVIIVLILIERFGEK